MNEEQIARHERIHAAVRLGLGIDHTIPRRWNLPVLSDYDAIVVNSSGGKDSQTALAEVLRMADASAYPRARIIVSHQCLGQMEWEGTRALAKQQADHYGLEFKASVYRDNRGDNLSLLEYALKRGKWPDNKNRWCTSEFKRGPGGRVLTIVAQRMRALTGKDRVRLLNVFGFRAQESPARAKKKVLSRNTRQSRGNQIVDDFLPIFDWTEAMVWADIRGSGVPHHPAYNLGMPRLSCVFCIFAPKGALILAGKHNPDLLQRYVDVERAIGHKFTNKLSLEEVQRAVQAGEQPGRMDGAWNM